MRLVLDTDVVVAAMRSPAGASAAIVRAARESRVTILLSVALVLEYEAVCGEAEHRTVAGLSPEEAEIYVTALIAMAEPVPVRYIWRPQLRDPADEMVLEAAVNGGADALVTFNTRDFGSTPARFGIEVLLLREVIGRLK